MQQRLEMRVFLDSELILFVGIDILRRCQHFFFSHVATFSCPPRLNKYLAENRNYKVLPLSRLKIAIL